jgi:hypothetical protein
MVPAATFYGFRIVGSCHGRRRRVDMRRALPSYAACDEQADVSREGYLSHFIFPKEFDNLLLSTGSPKGYDGPCCSSYLRFDVDYADDLGNALQATRRLVCTILERYRDLGEDDLTTHFSGSKGFHLEAPLAWNPPPSTTFNRVSRRLAEKLTGLADVKIDMGIYDKVRPFRAPNSLHPKTGLHKRRLTHGELMGLSISRIMELAKQPNPFALPWPAGADPVAVAEWQQVEEEVRLEMEGQNQRKTVTNGAPKLNRSTLAFIREGAGEGDRHRLLFSAAANLAEFGCPPALAHALLSDPGLDCALSPSDVRRQIDCGLEHKQGSPQEVPHGV